jgi:prevent-host-death family protein
VRVTRRRTKPEIILRNGEPRAVILDIEEYREMLERLEDAEDLRELEKMRRRPLRFRRLEEFLEEHRGSV